MGVTLIRVGPGSDLPGGGGSAHPGDLHDPPLLPEKISGGSASQPHTSFERNFRIPPPPLRSSDFFGTDLRFFGRLPPFFGQIRPWVGPSGSTMQGVLIPTKFEKGVLDGNFSLCLMSLCLMSLCLISLCLMSLCLVSLCLISLCLISLCLMSLCL
jgi:hypothetical protein